MHAPIKIVSLEETVDNWGRTELTQDLLEIQTRLQDAAEFSDDWLLYDDEGHRYLIDELIGHQVQVGESIFVVPAD